MGIESSSVGDGGAGCLAEPKYRVWWALESPKGPNVELGGPLRALKSLNVKLEGPLKAPRVPNVNHPLAKPHLHTSTIIARVTKGVESCIQPLLQRHFKTQALTSTVCPCIVLRQYVL